MKPSSNEIQMKECMKLLAVLLCLSYSVLSWGQCSPGDLDSDADGICDTEDTDDDNDGIPDTKETVCEALLSDLSFYGDAIDNVDDNTIYLTNPGGWRSSYSSDTLSLPIHIEFLATTSNYRMIGLLPLGATEKTNEWNDGAYKLYTHQNNYTYGKLTNAWTFLLYDYNNKILELDINESGKLTVTLDDNIVYMDTAPVTDYRLAVSSNNGGTFGDVLLSYRQPNCIMQDIDTDGDNIPNRLDLDSDNDLCVDAFEGSASFGLNNMDGNGRLLGSVDMVQTSATYGLPILADTGQAVGESMIAYSPVIDFRACLCIAANNPTDSDNDGVCDAVDICENVPNNLIGTPCDDGNSNTINDLWTSTCECLGTPICTPGELDSDADGVCDLEDQDDDNDGILDENETICNLALTDLDMYGDAIVNVESNKINLNAYNAWRSSYSTDTFSLPLHLEFKADISHYKMIGFLPLRHVERTGSHEDAAYKLYVHTNGRIYGKLPTQWTFNAPEINGKLIEMDIDLNGNISIKVEGEEVYAGIAPISDYKLAVTSNNGGSFDELVITHGQIPCIIQEIDSDGDNIPNRLDLDSDNDRCVDAFEGSADFDLNDMDGDGRLTGSIDLNQGSTIYGLPLVANTGQGLGESTNTYSPLIDTRACLCIAANNPIDSDNDGLCDDIDVCDNIPDNQIGTPCDDGDNTTTNDIWTSNCDCVGITACTPSDLDTDLDGICDLEDQDDDNDGIADRDEMLCSIPLTDFSFYGNAIDSVGITSIMLTNNNGWRSSYSSDILSLPLHLEFPADNSTHRMIGFLPIDYPEVVNNWNDGAYKLYVHTNGTLYSKLPEQWTFTQAGISNKLIEMDIDLNGNVSVKMDGTVIYTGTAPVSDYRIAVSSHSGGSFNDVAITYGQLPCINSDIDSDDDGIPNRLDFDSDGDLCVDAFEGDAELGLNDMDDFGKLLGGVNMTPGSDTYGIPLSAGNGQGAGESASASFPVIELRECMCIASNNPTDSDADGTCDAIDICDNMSDALIGTACDDGDACTVNDVWTNTCECKGIFMDADGDNVCDFIDTCPDFDDGIDIDADNIPDCLDACIDYNQNGICDDIEIGFSDDELYVYTNRRRGYYEQPFDLQLLCSDPNASIYYTIDGSAPADTSLLYDGSPILIDTTTVVRVISYVPGDTSKVVTFSYLFADYMLQQVNEAPDYPTDMEIDNSVKAHPYYEEQLTDALQGLPTVSIVMDINDFNAFYYEKEIQSPLSIELLYPDGTNYQQNGGVESYGNSTFNQAKKNFRFLFKEEFGESKFRYPIFGEDAAGSFDYWVLRAGGQETTNRGGAQNLNDQVFRDLQLITSGSASHGDFFHVTVNGRYWGVYNAAERPQKSFGESYFGGDKDDWNTMKGTCCDVNERAIDGDLQTYDNLLNNINNLDSAAKYLDIDHYINYVMINNYGPHGDWRTWNTYAVDNPKIGEPIRFFIWDAEPSMASDWYYVTRDTRTVDMNDIYDPLAAQLEFRVKTGDQMECNCFNEGTMTPQKVKDRYQYWFDKTEKAFLWETGRWQDISTYDRFINYRDRVFDHIDARTDTLIVRYREAELYPAINAVQFSQYGGTIPDGFQLTLSNPNPDGTIYYTTDGSDPRLKGGGISPAAQIYNGNISVDGVVTINARVKSDTIWSAMCPRIFYGTQNYQDVVINEIMYHPDSLCAAIDATELDYIELLNTGTETVNLTNCSFKNGITFDFPYSTEIQPGSLLVLAENSAEFEAAYGFSPFGQYKGGLSNDGERLLLADPFGNVMDSLTYNDKNPWDEDPDGNGPSLELLDPYADNNNPVNWFRSDNNCGTPGQANSRVCTSTAEAVVINEINYNSNNDGFDPGDWVELYNPNATAVDISGWTFYDNSNEFIIPVGTSIEPDDFLIIVEDETIFSTSFPHLEPDQYLGNFVFGLSNKGERISLFDENKCLSDYVVFNDKLPWDTIPDGNGPSLSLIEPDLDNTESGSWEASSYINSAYGTPGRPNVPCPESTVIIPATVCAGFPVNITIDSLYSRMSLNWILFGANPPSATTDSVQLVWNTPGTYNIQLVSSYFECTKIYTQQVTVESCNEPPVANNDSFVIKEDNALNDVTNLNDSDPDGDNLVWNTTPVTSPSNGSLSINIDGTFTYTPNPGFIGNDSFEYEVCDDGSHTPLFIYNGQVKSGEDDVEELAADGSINTGSGDLDLMDDDGQVYSAVGIRLTNINVPANAIITNAYFEFVADESNNQATSLTISAEAVGNAASIPESPFALSNKIKTAATANWPNIPNWTAGNTYISDDISPVVQEIVARADWQSGNAMTFIFEGTGTRTPETYEGGASVAPKLIVNYQLSNSNFSTSMCDQAIVSIEVEPGCIQFDIAAFLQGPFDTTTGTMYTDLNTLRGLLPGQTPLSGIASPTTPGQPYNTSPWNYNGTEGLSWTDANYTDDIVDWVLVSTRTDINKSSEVGMAAGLLTQNGTINFIEGCALENIGLDSVYIVIEHRNHIGIMTPQKVSIVNKTLSWDFRYSDSYKDATSYGQKEILPGTWVMFAGDGDQSDFPSFDIKGTDKTLWLNNNGIFQQYEISDFDLNGDVNGADKVLWFENNGVSSRVPK